MADETENGFPTSETIESLIYLEIQMLKNVEMASTQLFQALGRKIDEIEKVKKSIKKRKDVTKLVKLNLNDITRRLFGLNTNIWGYWKQLESQRIWLESMQEKLQNDLAVFKQMQEEIDNF